jgi:predicted DNA-binding protein (UPF0251 family)
LFSILYTIGMAKIGKASPLYGKLMTATLPSEIKSLWYSRDDELPELPRHNWSFDLITDMDPVENRDLLFKILENCPLTDREMLAIKLIEHEGYTLDEAAQELDCGRERARQIHMKAMRKIRTYQIKITGKKLWALECEVMTWRRFRQWTREST